MKKQILCIDKSPDAEETYKSLIGYKFHFATDSNSGCRVLENNREISTVLLDDLVDNPISCLVKIKKRFKDKKIVVITESEAVKSFALTCENCLLVDPPFDLDSIQGRLR